MSTRISTEQIYQRHQANIAKAREKETISSQKAASGKELLHPSENPSGFLSINWLKENLDSEDVMSKNGKMASHVLSMTEGVLTRLQDVVQRAHELAVSASGDTTEGSRKHISEEAKTLFENALQTVNSKYSNRTLLAGFRNDGPAFNEKGEYLGDSGEINIEIARGLIIPINMTGDKAILGNGLTKGVNILQALSNLYEGLSKNNTELLRSTLDTLLTANDQISVMRGEIGARMKQIDIVNNQQEMSRIESLSEISRIEDADSIKVFSELARDETILKAAIATGQKLLSDNPTDILFK